MGSLKVIGAGYGRTGTDSLRIALTMLGYSCHHMKEMFGRELHPEAFLQAYEHPDQDVDWDLLYEGYDAALGWPTVKFVDRLIKQYPDSKVILTYRDPDSWYKSVADTLNPMYDREKNQRSDVEYLNRLVDMYTAIAMDGAISDSNRFKDEETIKKKYVAHIEWVKNLVPADRLLVLQLGEGWDRLCEFLDAPVPNEPYPRANSTEEIWKMRNARDDWIDKMREFQTI